MDAAWYHYYGIVHRFSLVTGIWPYMSPRERIYRIVPLTAIVLTVLVPQVAYQFTCKESLQCTVKAMTSYLFTIVASMKVCTFLLNISTVKNLTGYLVVSRKRSEAPAEYEIRKSFAENCRLFSLIYPTYCFITVIFFMSVSVMPHVFDIVSPLNESRPKLMPYPSYYFVDDEKYFIYIYCHSIVGWEIMIVGIVAHDCMFVAYVEQVCSMLAVVGLRLEYLFCNCKDLVENQNGDRNNIYRKKIGYIMQTHREALKNINQLYEDDLHLYLTFYVIRFAQHLEDIFTMPFAVQLIISTILLSVTLLQMTGDTTMFDNIRYVLYVWGQMIHLFFLSFEGQKLIDYSVQTRDRIYASSWYEAPLKSQRLLILVMMRTLRPIFLRAGKIYIFSLENFTTILQTSMSYFTVLASFQ